MQTSKLLFDYIPKYFPDVAGGNGDNDNGKSDKTTRDNNGGGSSYRVLNALEFVKKSTQQILDCHDKRIPCHVRDMYKKIITEGDSETGKAFAIIFDQINRSFNQLTMLKKAVLLGSGFASSRFSQLIPLDRAVRGIEFTIKDAFNFMRYSLKDKETISFYDAVENPYFKFAQIALFAIMSEYAGNVDRNPFDEPKDFAPTDDKFLQILSRSGKLNYASETNPKTVAVVYGDDRSREIIETNLRDSSSDRNARSAKSDSVNFLPSMPELSSSSHSSPSTSRRVRSFDKSPTYGVSREKCKIDENDDKEAAESTKSPREKNTDDRRVISDTAIGEISSRLEQRSSRGDIAIYEIRTGDNKEVKKSLNDRDDEDDNDDASVSSIVSSSSSTASAFTDRSISSVMSTDIDAYPVERSLAIDDSRDRSDDYENETNDRRSRNERTDSRRIDSRNIIGDKYDRTDDYNDEDTLKSYVRSRVSTNHLENVETSVEDSRRIEVDRNDDDTSDLSD